MAEEEVGEGAAGAADEQDEPIVAADDGKGGKVVPLSALMGYQKDNKALKLRLKELEPIAARSQEIDARLVAAQPIIDAIVTNPKLRAEALRMAQGTRVSSEYTAQPEDDEDAKATAEEFGFYMNDGVTPDSARGRRVLDRMDARTKRTVDAGIGPLANATLGQRADANIQRAIAETDDRGVPIATRESIMEIMGTLPHRLLADPAVVELVLNTAAGIDRRKGRTPKEADEPLYMASAGSGRGTREVTVTQDERDFARRQGISEKDYLSSVKKLQNIGREGIILGGS